MGGASFNPNPPFLTPFFLEVDPFLVGGFWLTAAAADGGGGPSPLFRNDLKENGLESPLAAGSI